MRVAKPGRQSTATVSGGPTDESAPMGLNPNFTSSVARGARAAIMKGSTVHDSIPQHDRETALRYAQNSPEWAAWKVRTYWNNPQFRAIVTEKVRNEIAHRRRFSARWLLEQVRKVDIVDLDGHPFKVNNSVGAALGRLILREFPEAEGLVELRRSKVDGLI